MNLSVPILDEESQTEEKRQWLAVNLTGSDWDWLGQVGPLTRC